MLKKITKNQKMRMKYPDEPEKSSKNGVDHVGVKFTSGVDCQHVISC